MGTRWLPSDHDGGGVVVENGGPSVSLQRGKEQGDFILAHARALQTMLGSADAETLRLIIFIGR